MNLFLHLVAVVSLQCGSVIVNGQNYVLTSSCGGGVLEGSSCVFTCETGNATENFIAWTRGSSSTFEVDHATCTTSNPPAPSEYVLACPGTSYTLNITSASVARDKTTWRCSYGLGGKPSSPINLDVQGTTTTPPTTTATTSTPASQSTAAPVPVPEACGFALIAVIILVVLLVMKIATDVIFVGYRWGDRFGVKCKQICKQIIDTDKRKYILYWICFVQGIINSICGVTFFIVICLAYPNCLGDGLPIAVLVLCIIVLITGVINIVMCLCCCCCPQSSDPGKPGTCGMCAKPDDPSPWLCCCRGTVQPGHTSSPDHPPPSSLPPIPPSMASPRKPVPPSSTTPRTLPSPTSDPASDSAVNPTVLLEPLSVEEPKKKKKKRKKRKNKNEAEGESSNQLKNPTGDSDE